MDEKYLSIFDDLFLDVEKYPPLKELINDINMVLSGLIIKYGEIVNELSTEDDRDNPFVDSVVVMFCRKIMEHIDAINILLSKSCFSQAEIILRTLMESIVSVKFILKEDTELRAASYYLYHHYEEMEKIKYLSSDDDEGKMMKKFVGEEKFNETAIRANNKKDALQRIINKDATFKIVDDLRNKKIEDKQNKKGNKYVQWYEVVSKYKNFHQLMRYVGWDKYYESLYGGLSFEAHGYNAANSITVKDDGFYLNHIRSPKNGANSFNLTCTFSISALKDIYKYLGDGAEENQEFIDYYYKYKKMSDDIVERLQR